MRRPIARSLDYVPRLENLELEVNPQGAGRYIPLVERLYCRGRDNTIDSHNCTRTKIIRSGCIRAGDIGNVDILNSLYPIAAQLERYDQRRTRAVIDCYACTDRDRAWWARSYCLCLYRGLEQTQSHNNTNNCRSYRPSGE